VANGRTQRHPRRTIQIVASHTTAPAAPDHPEVRRDDGGVERCHPVRASGLAAGNS
jgi:hypothetical protein